MRVKGRPKTKKGTTLVRAPTDLVAEWNINFPEVPTPHLLRVMYNTSLVKLENGLRKNKKK